MDDRALEARLRAHLHATLDDAQPSPELATGIRGRLAPQAAALGVARVRPLASLRWGVVLVATAAVAAVAIAFGGLAKLPPAGAVVTPEPSIAPSRDFIVLAPSAAVPDKQLSSDASDVLAARLRGLGFGTFSGAGGYGIEFQLDEPGIATDDQVRAVLAAPGVVDFVPLPAADYSTVSPTIGKPLPKAEPALFGNDGVASVTTATDGQGHPTLEIHLTAAAASAFGEYTTRHINEQVAILIDGNVALDPIIQAPITGGVVEIIGDPSSSAGIDPVTKAILIGGPLPEAWRGASVPTTLSREEAIAAAVAAASGAQGGPTAVGLEARAVGGAWRAVWSVTFSGSFPDLHCTATGGCPGPLTVEVVLIDAINGGVMGYEAPSP